MTICAYYHPVRRLSCKLVLLAVRQKIKSAKAIAPEMPLLIENSTSLEKRIRASRSQGSEGKAIQQISKPEPRSIFALKSVEEEPSALVAPVPVQVEIPLSESPKAPRTPLNKLTASQLTQALIEEALTFFLILPIVENLSPDQLKRLRAKREAMAFGDLKECFVEEIDELIKNRLPYHELLSKVLDRTLILREDRHFVDVVEELLVIFRLVLRKCPATLREELNNAIQLQFPFGDRP